MLVCAFWVVRFVKLWRVCPQCTNEVHVVALLICLCDSCHLALLECDVTSPSVSNVLSAPAGALSVYDLAPTQEARGRGRERAMQLLQPAISSSETRSLQQRECGAGEPGLTIP